MSLRLDFILSGLEASNTSEEFNVRQAEDLIPGSGFGIGGTFSFPLNKARSLRFNTTLASEFRNFTRRRILNYPAGEKFKEKNIFQSIFLVIPIALEQRISQWSIYASIAPTLNFRTRYAFEQCFAPVGADCDYQELHGFVNNIGESFEASNYMIEEVRTERWLDLQFGVGIRYRLNEFMSLNLEYRDFILKNNLQYFYFDYDVGFDIELEQQTNAIYIGLVYDLVKIKS